MKNAKRKVFVIALAVSLAAIISMGTLAWFSDFDSVTNNFMVAESDDDTRDDIFSVDVYEKNVSGTVTQYGLNYSDILPGDTRVKDVHVTNTGYYNQYIRVIVTISDADAWKATFGEAFNDASLVACFGGFDQTKWNHITTEVYDNGTTGADETADDVIRIVMYYNEILKGEQSAEEGDDITVFTAVNIPDDLTREAAAMFGDDGEEGFSISVLAQAVQTLNVVPDGTAAEDKAYAAFQTVGMTY